MIFMQNDYLSKTQHQIMLILCLKYRKQCIAINYRLYIPTMNNDDYRKTFCRPRRQQDITPHKKKTHCIVKLPSVRQTQQQSGNYLLGNIIGEGGFAKVRMCTLKKGGEQFVMKIFEKFRLNTQEKRKGVMREIEIMKCLKHSSIIKIVDYFETPQTINIIMEYFSLTSLATYAKTHRPISDSSLRSIVRQIAEAISYLHGLKIAHRDIKPENILINQKQEIKVIDLGLSMMGEQIQVKVAGTPFYMSPELVSKRQYDPFKADIWAFGILLYWLTLGYFPQDNEPSKKKKHSKTFHLHFPADMHPGIQYLISKMLQQEPNERLSVEQILTDTWVQPKDFKNQISKLMKKLSNPLEGQ